MSENTATSLIERGGGLLGSFVPLPSDVEMVCVCMCLQYFKHAYNGSYQQAISIHSVQL